MKAEVERAREDLALARATSERLWAEHSQYAKTLDPARGAADREELRRLQEASEWQARVYAAEHALFGAEHGSPGIVGSNGPYQWLTMVDCDITSLVTICPEVVLGQYLAVTSADSGALHLLDEEKSAGWWTAEAGRTFQGDGWSPREYHDDWEVAYSPLITSIHQLPNQTHDGYCAGFDEWYVFEKQVPAGEIETFVSWLGFRLYDPGFRWCADRFWDQMARINPESYIADGSVFTVVTRNAALFDRILRALLVRDRREKA